MVYYSRCKEMNFSNQKACVAFDAVSHDASYQIFCSKVLAVRPLERGVGAAQHAAEPFVLPVVISEAEMSG